MLPFRSVSLAEPRTRHRPDAGFSLPELLVATTIFLIVSAVVTTALNQMVSSQQTIWNRTELHGGVRNATELLQQEVGQAGRVALPSCSDDELIKPTCVTLTAKADSGAATMSVSSAGGMFVGELLTVDAGLNRETVKVGAIAGNTITLGNPLSTFVLDHAVGAFVNVFGGFATGIVPTATANGSTGTVLKLYGDINGDGNMVYVEYTCDTAAGNLYRNMMPMNAGAKPAVTAAQVLLGNLQPNPGGAPCFTYVEQQVNGGLPGELPSLVTFVTNVAITLTVQTQQIDPITQQYQTETKALLNVAPRNVFEVWELASPLSWPRVQPMPLTVVALLP
jgi:prepilin-type N-terminal cleavage/methylation domain-containing protein